MILTTIYGIMPAMKLLWSLLFAATMILCSYQLVFAVEPSDFDPAITYQVRSQPLEPQTYNSHYSVPEAGTSGTPVQLTLVESEPSWIGNLWQTVKANVSHTAREVASFVSWVGTSIRTTVVQYTPAPIRPFVVLGLAAIPTLAVLAWRSKALAPIRGLSFVLSSLSDLVMHTISGVAAGIQSIISPVRFINAYQANKNWIKTHLKRDIGNGWQDLLVGALVGGAVALLLIGPEVVAATGSFITTATPTYLAVKGPDIMNETNRECLNPIQCSTPIDFFITLGINVVTAGLPDFEVDQGVIALKNRAFSFMKASDDVADAAHVVAVNFTREDLERRVGREFVQEIFGDATSADFDNIARKWPNALERLHEGEKRGHVLAEHVGKDYSFLKHRLDSKKFLSSASSYDNPETMLNSLENTLTAENNLNRIRSWLLSSDEGDLVLTSDSRIKLGNILKRSDSELKEGYSSVTVLRKSDGSYYIHTSYVE